MEDKNDARRWNLHRILVEKSEKLDIIGPSRQRDVDAKKHRVFSLILIFGTLMYREGQDEKIIRIGKL